MESAMAKASIRAVDVTPAKLAEDLHMVVEDAESLLKATAGQAGEKIQELRAKAQESVAAVRERLTKVEEAAMHQAKAAAAKGNAYVHENPWAAIGIAAGAGLLIGMLLARR